MNTSTQFRIWHRYLGYFLAGIMAVYALSGMLLIFRDTDFLKEEKTIQKTVKPNATGEELGQLIGIKQLKVKQEDATAIAFENGTYNKQTGEASYVVKELPKMLNKMTKLHKAKSAEPLFFLNVFFGVSLLFFVISAFWMFLPGTTIFRKGMYFTIAGIVLTLVLLFI